MFIGNKHKSLTINNRHSIRKLKSEDVFKTSGSYPVLVYCDDFTFYVTKYPKGVKANDLLREYIAASFLQTWNLAVPEFAFVHVRKEHVEKGFHSNIQPYYFDSLCFGSKFSRSYKDVTSFLAEMPYTQKRDLSNKDEFLLIALFDIWMSNEDRNRNNMNLMYDLENGDRFIPIDHQFVFNSGNLERGLNEITYEESILDTPICSRLFNSKYLTDQDRIDNLKNNFYLYVANCKQKVNNFLKPLPVSWKINKENYATLLRSKLFNETWIDNSWLTFLKYIQYSANR